MTIPSRFTLALSAASLLACSSIGGKLMDAAENSPEFQEAFKESFQEEFTKSCSKPIVDQGMKKGQADKICACAGEELLAQTSTKELMQLMTDPGGKEAAKVFGPVMETCTKKFAKKKK